MSYQAKGISLSIVAHAIFFSLFLSLASYKPIQKKIIALDFSIIESLKPVAAPAPKTAVKPEPLKPVKKIKETPKPVIRKGKLPGPKLGPVIKKEPLTPEPVPVEQTDIIEPITPIEEVMKEPDIFSDIEEETFEDVSLAQAAIDSPAPPSSTGSAADAKAQYLKHHFLYIKEAIQKNIIYPRVARRRGWQGTATVSLVVCEDGTVTDIKIVEGSGFTLLDKNAIASVKKAAPFPAPPARAEIVVPIAYKLS